MENTKKEQSATERKANIQQKKQELFQLVKERQLKSLVHEGGYRTLNEAIVSEVYTNDIHKTFNTVGNWNKKGMKVIKGQKGFPVWSKPRQGVDQLTGETFEFFRLSYIFSNAQVEPMPDYVPVTETA